LGLRLWDYALWDYALWDHGLRDEAKRNYAPGVNSVKSCSEDE